MPRNDRARDLKQASRSIASLRHTSYRHSRPIEPKGGDRLAIAMTTAEAGGKPCDRSSRQKGGRRHEGQDHRVGASATDSAAGLGNHLGHPAFGIRLGQSSSRHDQANEIGAILGRHVRMPKAGGDDFCGLGADIRLNSFARAAVGSE